MPTPPRWLPPDGYLTAEQVAADLGVQMPAMYQRIRRGRGDAPPFERFGTGRRQRYAITPEDYAAWKRARHRADAVELSQKLAAQAEQLRQEAAEREQAARDALLEATRDAAAS